MPHTRAARLKAMKDASYLRDMVQLYDASLRPGWNQYLDWDVPDLTYLPEALAWVPDNTANANQPPFYADAHSSTANAPNRPLDNSYDQPSNTEFCGLQPWYSNTAGAYSPVSQTASTRPQLSSSAFTSYESAEVMEIDQPIGQTNASQHWSTDISRRQTPLDENNYPWKAPEIQPTDPIEDVEDHLSPSSEDEVSRINLAKSDAHKKRKIAHSVIEKNYRCRIQDGMAELRHCVPSRERGRRSLDSKGHSVRADAMSNHSSGKVAILSDAVQYVRELERRNEGLNGQLDMMNRRNITLQKIALSKVDTTVSVDEIAIEDGKRPMEGALGGESGQNDRSRSRKGVGGNEDSRFNAVPHAPSHVSRNGSGKGRGDPSMGMHNIRGLTNHR